MELFDAILTRSSAARLSAPGPTPPQWAAILEAAARAPDHGRLKPWRLIVLDAELRGRFIVAVVAARQARAPVPTEEQLQLERDKINRAPAILVVACAIQPHPKVPEIEQIIATGAAAQNAFLAAHALGLGVMWKTGPAAYESGVKQALGLRADDHIVGIMHVGTRTS
jgi:nitroreductase